MFKSKKFWVLLLILACLGLGYATLAMTPPFAWLFALLATLTVLCALLYNKSAFTCVAMVVMPLFAVASFMEFYLDDVKYNTLPMLYEGSYKSNWEYQDPVRGYGPKPQAGQTRSRAVRAGNVLYNVTYTTNAQGWRLTPQHRAARTAVIFFGCSFTFGEGVEDHESYPWQVAQQLGPDYQVFNFGFHGYGAHQFLASVESGLIDDILRSYPTVYIYYLNLARHEMRASGYSEWDEHGPQYTLEEGRVVRRGNFDHWYNREGWRRNLHRVLRKSHLYKDLYFRPRQSQLEPMRQLDCALIVRARDVLQQKKPDMHFTVLTYPGAEGNIARFTQAGLTAVDATPFFPGSPHDPVYTIQSDGHPTARAHKVLAQGIARHIREQ